MKWARHIRSAVFAAVLIVIAWLISHFGRGGPGPGAGSDQVQTPAAATTNPAQAAGPVEVTIREDRYLVDGKELTLQQVIAAAASRGTRPAIKIITGPDSRLGAQRDLQKALENAHLPSSLESDSPAEP